MVWVKRKKVSDVGERTERSLPKRKKIAGRFFHVAELALISLIAMADFTVRKGVRVLLILVLTPNYSK